jgi:hypothetical protein
MMHGYPRVNESMAFGQEFRIAAPGDSMTKLPAFIGRLTPKSFSHPQFKFGS